MMMMKKKKIKNSNHENIVGNDCKILIDTNMTVNMIIITMMAMVVIMMIIMTMTSSICRQQ